MAETEELSDEVKTFIVQSLACFDTPTQVAKAVKDDFDLVVSRQRVYRYDPTKAGGKDLSEKLKQVFSETRKKYIEETADIGASIGIANKIVRLRRLDRMATAAEERGNMVLAAALIEQAAKEVGGSYTNETKTQLTGANGAPLTAAVTLTGRPDPAPAPKTMGGVRNPSD